MNCVNQESNKQSCNCTYPCAKQGLCCQCITYHRSRNELPACYFPAQAEKSYNRSIEHFVRLYQSGQLT